MLCFLLKCLETACAESMRKGTKKLAKNKMKWDLFSFLYPNKNKHPTFYIIRLFFYNIILSVKNFILLLYL